MCFYRKYFSMHKRFSGFENVWGKSSRNDPKGMECLLSGEREALLSGKDMTEGGCSRRLMLPTHEKCREAV